MATKVSGGSSGGGNVPLVNWMLGLDASGAMQSLEDLASSAAANMEKMQTQAKSMFPGSTFDVIAKSSKVAFSEMAKDAAAAGFAAERAFEKAAAAADKMNRQAAASSTLKGIAGIGIGAGILGGRALINQGMATSGIGAVAGFYNEQLARQVAGVFAPITQENIGRVAEMTQWFRNLTGAQQESIRMMSMFTATTTGLLYVLPRASSALATMMGASAGVSKAFGIAGIGASIGIGLMASTPEGRRDLTDIAKAFEPAVEGLMQIAKDLRPAIAAFSDAVKQLATFKVHNDDGTSNLPTRPAADAGFSTRQWFRARLGMTPERNPNEASTNTGNEIRRWFGYGPATASSDQTARSDLAPRANGFEMPVDTWERLNTAAQNIELAQQTANNTARAVEILQDIAKAVMTTADGARKVMGGVPGNGPLVVD